MIVSIIAAGFLCWVRVLKELVRFTNHSIRFRPWCKRARELLGVFINGGACIMLMPQSRQLNCSLSFERLSGPVRTGIRVLGTCAIELLRASSFLIRIRWQCEQASVPRAG
jgi:hypothetical protein